MFTKLLKATVSFVMFVCPSVCMKQLVPHSLNFKLEYFLNIFKKFWVSLKPGKSNRCFTWRSMSVCPFFVEWEILQTEVMEKIKTFYVQWFFPKIYEKMWKICWATDDYAKWCMHFGCWLTKATDTHTHTCT